MVAFIWGFLVIASFIGWGVASNRLLFGQAPADWGLRAGWGLALTACSGAFFNLVGVISTTLAVVWVAVGGLVLALSVVQSRGAISERVLAVLRRVRRDRLVAAGALVVVSLAFAQYAGSVRGEPFRGFTSSLPYFNNHDDFQAYFVYPREMLRTGSLTRDPFNERRMTSSLGGESYLDTLILGVLPEQSLHLLEPGIGMLLVLGLLIGLLAELRAPPELRLAVCALPLLVAVPVVNISSVAIALALFLTLARTLVRSSPRGRLEEVPGVSLISAALVASKNSVIPATGVLLGLWYFANPSQPWRIRVQRGVGVLVLTTALLAPWMISLHRSSGTFLYPILGQGDHGTRYGTFYSPLDTLTPRHIANVLFSTSSSVTVIAVALILAASWLVIDTDQVVRVARALGWAALAGTAAVALLIGYGVDRFSYAFNMAALLLLVTTLILPRRTYRGPDALRIGAVALVAGLIIGGGWTDTKAYYRGLTRGLSTAFASQALVRESERARYQGLQRSVPQGDALLARVEKPFLLDFKRNPIYVVDWPGGASPPPGLPLHNGAEALAGYLQRVGVRYVTYSYMAEGGFPRNAFAVRLHLQAGSFDRVTAANVFAFQNLLSQLGRTRRHLYDDGANFVLDLARHTADSNSGQ